MTASFFLWPDRRKSPRRQGIFLCPIVSFREKDCNAGAGRFGMTSACRGASSLAGPSQSKPCGFASSPERGSFIRADLQKTSSPLGGAGERSEPERVLPAARLFPQEISAADAVFLHDPTRENAMPGGPQTARHCSIINNSSAEYAQSSAERIPIVFLRTAPQPPDAPVKHTAMPRCTGSPP